MNLSEAQNIAVDICYKLQPHCDKINIVGSIRRKKPDVKDIEICVLPKLIDLNEGELDLFGQKLSPNFAVNDNFETVVKSLGKIENGSPNGRYCKIVLPQGINLDLFIPEPADYYRQYAVRTGSAEYSFKVIATAWRRLGWVVSDLGLRLEKDCIENKQLDGKSKWTCMRNKSNAPPVWRSEEHFFEWLQVPFVKPEFRNI